jgi:hypothetical protein
MTEMHLAFGLMLDTDTSTWRFESASPAQKAVAAAVASGHCNASLLTPLLESESQLCLHELGGIQVFTGPAHASADSVDRTGALLWFTATVLIEYLRSVNAILPGSRMCEVGSGCGAGGLALHYGNRCEVTLTDVAEQLPLLHLNAGLKVRAVMQREAAHWAACWYSCVAERQVARYEWCAGSGAGSMHKMGAGIAGVLVRALCAGELRAVVVMQWRFIPAGLKRWRSWRRHFCRLAAKPAIRQWRRLACRGCRVGRTDALDGWTHRPTDAGGRANLYPVHPDLCTSWRHAGARAD